MQTTAVTAVAAVITATLLQLSPPKGAEGFAKNEANIEAKRQRERDGGKRKNGIE